jgi:hypothetical protein
MRRGATAMKCMALTHKLGEFAFHFMKVLYP